MARRLPCPVEAYTQAVLERQRDLLSAVRTLRRSLNACLVCDARRGCTILEKYDAQVQEAIREVNEEFI